MLHQNISSLDGKPGQLLSCLFFCVADSPEPILIPSKLSLIAFKQKDLTPLRRVTVASDYVPGSSGSSVLLFLSFYLVGSEVAVLAVIREREALL